MVSNKCESECDAVELITLLIGGWVIRCSNKQARQNNQKRYERARRKKTKDLRRIQRCGRLRATQALGKTEVTPQLSR